MSENGAVTNVNTLVEPDFGEGFQPLTELESYYPTRLEYLAGKALQGLCTGLSEKTLRKVPRLALKLAQDMEQFLDDSAKS